MNNEDFRPPFEGVPLRALLLRLAGLAGRLLVAVHRLLGHKQL